MFVFSCDSTARGETPFHLGGREDGQKGTYWGHISSLEMSPGDISPHKKYQRAGLILFILIAIVVVIVIVIVSGTHVQGNSTRAPLSRYLGSRW